MTTFSASDAALEGFQVLKSHWRVVLGWAVFNLVAMIGVLVISVIFGVAVEVGAGAKSVATTVVPVVVTVGAALVETVIGVGLYRLLLRPQEPGFLHMRIGPDELRIVGVALIVICAEAVLAVVAYLVARTLQPVLGGAAGWTALVALAVAVWLILRFCLTGPATFAARRIDFAGSWRLTRRHAWGLAGMWLLNLCVIAMLWVVGWLTLFIVNGLASGFDSALTGPEALRAHPLRYLVEGVLSLMLTPVVLVLLQTPYVAAYKALSEPA